MHAEPCSWCGTAVDPEDGFRAFEPAGERRAVFCRLEHVTPWAIQGAYWSAGALDPRELGAQAEPDTCAHCGEALGEAHVLLVRHRGEHRIADAFCGVQHLLEWSKRGGRYA
jgi:hypothetical protein